MEDGYKGMIHQPNTSEAPSLINGFAGCSSAALPCDYGTGLTTADEMLYPSNLTFG